MLQDKISPFYQQILPKDILEIDLPEERFADCANCHHCDSDKNFRYHTKCCDFHPRLPNYMVGAILSDDIPELAEGKRRILEKIKSRKGITPYGIIAPVTYHNKFKRSRQNQKQIPPAVYQELKCPYYASNGMCTIYKYRSDICPIFFCMTSNGASGRRFWNLTNKYMSAVEQKLILFALQKNDYPILKTSATKVGTDTLKLETPAGEVKEEAYKQLWLEWEGREIEFYKKCYESIQALGPERVIQLLGIEESILEKQLQLLATQMFKVNIPDFLQLDTEHDLYKQLQNNERITLSEGQSFQFNPLQLAFLKSFKGTTPTLEIVQKSNLLKQNFVTLIEPLIKEGLLKQC